MKIALAVWQERISPVFDASRSLRVVQLTAEGKEERREEISLDVAYPSQRVTILMNQRIEVLICGAVSAPLTEMIAAAKIKVISFVAGEAEAVLAAFLCGELPSEAYTQPGCCGRRRRCRGGRNCQQGKDIFPRKDTIMPGGDGRGSQGGGRGRMGGQGSGPGGECVCPQCGHRESHQQGQPCFDRKCPKCGTSLVRAG